ncbi:MAG: DUF1761 family protein [Myxococcales bacterium FL481]|nr:MAG: DUF1761 family protein [Myxococcales bacterium FL481]
MILANASINWLAVLACVVTGQLLLTVWFAVIFAVPWARAYGGPTMTKAQHTKEVPGYTYAIGAACVAALAVALSLLRTALDVSGIGPSLALGLLVGLGVFVPMALPAYAFLRRWNAFALGAGSQLALVLALSVVLDLFA